MRREILVVLVLILLPAALLAQAPVTQPQSTAPAPAAAPRQAPAPAAPSAGAATAIGGSKVAVIDLQRAITENQEGKKAQEQFMAEINKRQGDFDKKQKSLDEMQNKLKTQAAVLSDTAKADLGKQIDQTTTDLNRMNEDAQKELGDLQQKLFRPIAERARHARRCLLEPSPSKAWPSACAADIVHAAATMRSLGRGLSGRSDSR